VVGLAVLGIIVVVAAVAVAVSAKVVQPHERLVIFRMGRIATNAVRGPGLVLLLPILDRALRVDMRPRSSEIVGARMPTADGKAVAVDATIRYQVVDALKRATNVVDVDGALMGVTTTTMRAIAVQQSLEELLVGRAVLTEAGRSKLAEVAPRWGVQLDGFDVTDVRPVD
jgi:regulator of protease activity HflC (stomatin/prohibitin superfamily)